MDPRHQKRIETVQNLYAWAYKAGKLPYPDDKKTKQILGKITSIDKYISKNAPKYPLDKIAKTDLAILRLSVYDLIFDRQLPDKVVIDEAVELAHELSGEKSYSFVNAVLGKVLTQKKP